ncbi:MAG: amidohydrolase family protein [Proteobacteria bacterium]|nr:amidohydrolase family protein [Pseudomonadota bacterium]
MENQTVITNSYFDGLAFHGNGPFSFRINKGRIQDILPGSHPQSDEVSRVEFIMPGLVEGHCHLFLDGGELDLKQRSDYLSSSQGKMLEVACCNVQATLGSGITLTRDAGDRFGVNHLMRQNGGALDVRSAGLGLRGFKQYGSFMAREVSTTDEILEAIEEIQEDSDDLKILLSGIIDFEAGEVKGKPQFSLEELKKILAEARAKCIRTFTHCSGVEGLEIAVEAGVDSIEHGFFMTSDILLKMADMGIAWVPTFSPVHFQWEHPELVGWDQKTIDNLRRILDSHLEHVMLADKFGVNLVAGSDAGSHGVPHGKGLIDELFFFLEAGISMRSTLQSATSRPRRLWGTNSAELVKGDPMDYVVLEGSPFKDPKYLRMIKDVVRNGESVLSMENRLMGN